MSSESQAGWWGSQQALQHHCPASATFQMHDPGDLFPLSHFGISTCKNKDNNLYLSPQVAVKTK